MQVFIANIDSISKNCDAFLACLAPECQLRASKFQNQTRKLQFILGHLMADKIGKKFISIAHKDKMVVVATASNAMVGVDIENTTIKRDFVEMSKMMNFKIPKSQNEFYESFTEYEATYKLGIQPACVRFIDFGDYLICVAANKDFVAPHLSKFNVDSFSKKHQ